MSFARSFAPEFFWGDDSVDPRELARSDNPTSVYQAILSLPDDQWAALARDIFNCSPEDLDPDTVLCKVEQTNTCRNLDSPVEVFVDSDGYYTLLIHEPVTEGT